jgi:hypothetical protein
VASICERTDFIATGELLVNFLIWIPLKGNNQILRKMKNPLRTINEDETT